MEVLVFLKIIHYCLEHMKEVTMQVEQAQQKINQV